MYTAMDGWIRIRLEVSREESRKQEVLRREGIGWDTLKKILAHPEPPGDCLKEPRPKPKIGPYPQRIARKTKPHRRNSATPPSGPTGAYGRFFRGFKQTRNRGKERRRDE